MLIITDLHKSFQVASGTVRALDGVSFTLPEGSMFGIMGASGCGKSTLLRMIAGLEAPNRGEIRIAGTTVHSVADGINVPPEKRNVALVFQSYAIWPHLTVFENAAFPLRVRGVSRQAVRTEVMHVLESVALADVAERPATALSGGQQQRLALARAFVSRPKLLLLDEPLSSLDARLRERMRVELKRMQREHGVTTIFVTHDQAEGLSLADTVAVMEGGKFMQLGTPRQIYETPADRSVADFIGSINLLNGRPTGRNSEDGDTLLATEWGEIATNHPLPRGAAGYVLGIRPERVLLRDGPGNGNTFGGVAKTVMYYGSHQEIFINISNQLVTAVTAAKTPVKPGDHVFFSVDAGDVTLISAQAAGAAS